MTPENLSIEIQQELESRERQYREEQRAESIRERQRDEDDFNNTNE
jgi:hypothetical protein